MEAHAYEVHPRKDKRGVDLISDALPFGRLWYLEVSDCEGRQDSGDLTWRGVYESARRPMTASPHRWGSRSRYWEISNRRILHFVW
jgi:hypothetical protein